MRYYLIIPAIALFLGCKKSSTSSPANNAPTFQFTVDGAVYHMDGALVNNNLYDSVSGALLIRQTGAGCTGTPDTFYELIAADTAGDWVILYTTPLSPLTVTTYMNSYSTLTTSSGICINNSGQARFNNYSPTFYDGENPGDYAIIAITSIHDGVADGTMSAQLTGKYQGPGIPATMVITDGQFKNIPIDLN
jgi:hypothetical protein